MKNNLVIPTILSITLIITGISVFIPVEQASTIHFEIIQTFEEALQSIIPQTLGPISSDVADLDADHVQIQSDITDAFNADKDKDLSNEDQTLSTSGGDVVLGTTEAGDGGGTVTCAEITGDAGLCDSNDAVDDGDTSSTNEIELSINGGTTTCADITGSADLCDGNDAVNDGDFDSTNELQTWNNLPDIPSGFADGVDDRVKMYSVSETQAAGDAGSLTKLIFNIFCDVGDLAISSAWDVGLDFGPHKNQPTFFSGKSGFNVVGFETPQVNGTFSTVWVFCLDNAPFR